MRRAFDLIRAKSPALKEAFACGMRAAGYAVQLGEPRSAQLGDVLGIWNRRGHEEQIAERFERAGGVVLVFENAYLPGLGYAVAKHRHNGGGVALVDDPGRAKGLIAGLAPWRASGGHVAVFPNRWIGPKDALMPANWAAGTVAALERATGREVRVKPHPGHWKRLPPGQVENDVAAFLEGAWAAVIWWSSAGLRALLRGVPVVSLARYWIGMRAAGRDLASIENPLLGDREAAMVDVANACLSPAEIAGGSFFVNLAEEKEAACAQ